MKKFLLSLFALFAATSAFAVTETLTVSNFGASGGSYSEYNFKSSETNVSYHAYTAVNSSNFQFNTTKAGSGIYSTANPGEKVITAITINVASGSNTISVYGSTTPFTENTASPAGDPIDDITGTSTVDFDPGKGYKYFYIVSKKGAVYVSSLEIVYQDEADPRTYVMLSYPSNYYEAYLGEDFSAPELTCPEAGALSSVTYESSDDTVATIDENGNLTILDDGTTTISAYIPEGDETYYSNVAKYDLVVKDPNAITVDLNTEFFGKDSGYTLYTKEHSTTGIEYVTDYFYTSDEMQYNTSNANGKGCGIAVVKTSPNFIISTVQIEFSTVGAGVKVFKQNNAFEAQTTSTAINTDNATQIGETYNANATVVVGAPAFAIVPAGSGVIKIKKVTVTYAKKVADDGSEMFTCEAFKDYMICKDDMVEISLPEGAPEVTYTVANSTIAEVEDGTILAYNYGNTKVTASWDAVPGKWMAGSTVFTVYVKYATLAEVIEDANNGTEGFVKEGQTYVGNFPVVVGADMGRYNYVTDGTAWALFYVDHNHGEGAILDAGWTGVLKFQNGLLEFEKITHNDITDLTGEFEIKSYENLDAADFESKINEVMILKNVKFTEQTPGSTGTTYIGSYNEQNLEFFNRFDIDAVNPAIYDVKCAVSYYKDKVQIYPIEYTFVSELPHVYTVKTGSSVKKEDIEIEEGNVIACNSLLFVANIYEDGELLEFQDQGDFFLYMNETPIQSLDDIVYYLPYVENAVYTIRKDGIDPFEIENPWKDVLSATAAVVNPVYKVITDKAEAGKGHVYATFNLDIETSLEDYMVDFYFEGANGEALYELEFDFDNGIENVNSTAHLTWVNNKPFCEIKNLAVVDLAEDIDFSAVNFGIKVVPTFPFLMNTPAQQGAAMRAPRVQPLDVYYVNAAATAISHEDMAEADSEVSGVADVVVDGETVVEFYNLQGVKVEGELAPGLYIRRQGNEASKVVVK